MSPQMLATLFITAFYESVMNKVADIWEDNHFPKEVLSSYLMQSVNPVCSDPYSQVNKSTLVSQARL